MCASVLLSLLLVCSFPQTGHATPPGKVYLSLFLPVFSSRVIYVISAWSLVALPYGSASWEHDASKYVIVPTSTPSAINPDTIRLNVSNSSKGLLVSWQYPRPKREPRCYESQLQHSTSCQADWQVRTWRRGGALRAFIENRFVTFLSWYQSLM